MSQENVEIVRRAFAAYSRRDVEGTLAHWALDGVVDWSNSRGPEARVYRGHHEIRQFIRHFFEAFEKARMELIDPVEIEDGLVLAENVTYFRGRGGIDVQAQSTFLIRLHEGRQTSLTLYQTRAEALEAAGLSE